MRYLVIHLLRKPQHCNFVFLYVWGVQTSLQCLTIGPVSSKGYKLHTEYASQNISLHTARDKNSSNNLDSSLQ